MAVDYRAERRIDCLLGIFNRLEAKNDQLQGELVRTGRRGVPEASFRSGPDCGCFQRNPTPISTPDRLKGVARTVRRMNIVENGHLSRPEREWSLCLSITLTAIALRPTVVINISIGGRNSGELHAPQFNGFHGGTVCEKLFCDLRDDLDGYRRDSYSQRGHLIAIERKVPPTFVLFV